MHAQTRRTSSVEPALIDAWERLQVHYARHRNAAPFWDAYQAIQDELTRSHPDHHVVVCNRLATLAERLGVVHHAQLLGEIRGERRHTGSTSP
ncbi:hypothetical protein ACYX79_02090 [Stenotrophomonas rhizophila]|uniref:hypothetical protein n=1 Tax=Stenotrophomonas sp. TWI819 TaxID=3136800 RepID=UPI003208AA53